MGGLRGKETEKEEEIKMVKNGEKQSLSDAFVGNRTGLVFINRHKIFFI